CAIARGALVEDPVAVACDVELVAAAGAGATEPQAVGVGGRTGDLFDLDRDVHVRQTAGGNYAQGVALDVVAIRTEETVLVVGPTAGARREGVLVEDGRRRGLARAGGGSRHSGAFRPQRSDAACHQAQREAERGGDDTPAPQEARRNWEAKTR